MSKALAEILVRDRVISQTQFDEAIKAVGQNTNQVVKQLISSKSVSEIKLLDLLGKKFNLPTINLAKFEISKNILDLLNVELVRRHQMIPIQTKGERMVVAICDPTMLGDLEKIRFITKLNVDAVLTTFSAFEEALGKYYGAQAFVQTALSAIKREEKTQMMKMKKEGDTSTNTNASAGIELVQVHNIDEGISGSIESTGEAVVAFVNGILSESIRKGASDIHVEHYEGKSRVRLRIDGTLLEITQIPPELRRAVVARLKIMSRMDVAESRVPQDGRIKLVTSGKTIDFRVNTLPTLFGEKVVLRLLSQGNLSLQLEKLGFEAQQLETFRKGLYSANGMVLVTGPTGSGKTTTLYSALMELNASSDNISTAEDPVEYNLEGINQVQVNKDVGLSFANVLRSLLRQDPDTILVGEIRDYETAEVSIQAALTGHLVLSTLHTNDAPSTITRLMNMGVEPFLVTSSVNTIVAQRLLRKVCQNCKNPIQLPLDQLKKLGVDPSMFDGVSLYEGKGCKTCGNSGYKGRVAVYEVLDFSPDLKEMVLKGAPVSEIRKRSIENGMKTLRASAISRVREGQTSLKEAIAMTMEG